MEGDVKALEHKVRNNDETVEDRIRRMEIDYVEIQNDTNKLSLLLNDYVINSPLIKYIIYNIYIDNIQ